MQEDSETTGTPAAFLAELGKALTVRQGEDADLAKIVCQHVLTAAPAENCVEQALIAMTALAERRASPPKVERVDG